MNPLTTINKNPGVVANQIHDQSVQASINLSPLNSQEISISINKICLGFQVLSNDSPKSQKNWKLSSSLMH